MGSDKYFFLLLAFFISNALGHHEKASNETTVYEEEELAKYLIDKTDKMHSIEELSKLKKGYGEKWIAMPDGLGVPVISSMEGNKTDITLSRSAIKTPAKPVVDNIQFYLFTPEFHSGKPLNLYKMDQTEIEFYKPFKIIIHGWMSSIKSQIIQGIKNAYLKENKYNVIGVDWSFYAGNVFYPKAAASTKTVGTYLGYVINNVCGIYKINYHDFHLIGHSLGAHVAGYAGSVTNQQVGRITGLDPALPSFQFVKRDERLDSSDATFVDVIHTCAGVLGMSAPVGHVDFYPNGGSPYQPGCNKKLLPAYTQGCSHTRSYDYYIESVLDPNGFVAVKCRSWKNFKTHDCLKKFAVMGDSVSTEAHGAYYLLTNDKSPFAKGEKGTIF